MKNIITEELGYMKYLLGYQRGVVISEQPSKTGCIQGDCENGKGTYKYSDGGVYVGQWKDGKMNGQGTLKFKNGDVYIGQFKDDKHNGKGTYKFKNGDVYIGQWKDGVENGQGTFKFKSGGVYIGQFKDDNFNGQGTFKFKDGGVYIGQFKDNNFNGQGTYTNINGVKSSGTWVDEKLNGKTTGDLDKLTQSNKTYTQAELDAVWGKPTSIQNPLSPENLGFKPKSAPAAAPAKPESTNKDNWDDVVKYYEGNKDPNWKFDEKSKDEYDSQMKEYIKVLSTDTNDDNAYMRFFDDGILWIVNKGRSESIVFSTWEWDGTKPVIKFKDITKNASGYVQPTDTDWSAVTEDNKIIGLNAKGPLVKQLQHSLIFQGYSGSTGNPITTDVQACSDDTEKCDGVYGKSTKEMVKQFQKDNGLAVDGIFGKQTYGALY